MKNIPRYLMILAAILLIFLFLFPIWRITLVAPQYPGGISMYIWINKITGDTPGTLQNINILNHYVGMKFIEPDSIPELKYFPFIIAGMAVLAIILAILNKRWLFLSWTILFVVLGILGIYDFYLWEYDYGHNLSPTAPIKVPGMAYQPPLFGTKMLLNFEASSYPSLGSLFYALSIISGFLAFYTKKLKIKNEKLKMKNEKWNMKFLTLLVVTSLVSASCSVGPEPIHYGEDNCVHCAMTIMDTRYGTEVVTKKGKVFKFDSVECLVEFLQEDEVDSADVKLILVTPFNRPEELVDATASHTLHSKDLPSPMGMFLTAFESEATALNFKEQFGGKVYSWEGLNRNFQILRLKGPVE